MIDTLLTPLHYDYMVKAILVSGLIGGVCAFLSCFITLKGWSLMGDALSHSVVPGVAVAYALGWPFAPAAAVPVLAAAAAQTADRPYRRTDNWPAATVAVQTSPALREAPG